jgi:hypothetical protein
MTESPSAWKDAGSTPSARLDFGSCAAKTLESDYCFDSRPRCAAVEVPSTHQSARSLGRLVGNLPGMDDLYRNLLEMSSSLSRALGNPSIVR